MRFSYPTASAQKNIYKNGFQRGYFDGPN